MINLTNVLALLAAYILGSIPSAVWIGRIFFGIDVREYGSGNAGATNTFRVLGKKAGIPVALIDILKGYLAVQLATLIGIYLPGTQQFVNFKLTLGVAALMGHIFPVFAGFRGGKGIATLLGIVIGVHPPAALICAGIFFATLIITNYVSLSSIFSAMAFPIIIMFGFHETVRSLNVFSIFVTILVLITHQKNIERLLRGEEGKVGFLRR